MSDEEKYPNRYKPGESGNPAGRPKGSLNRYTEIKHLICDTLIKRKDELDTMNLKEIVKFVSATAPKENKIEVNTPIVLRWQGDDEPEPDSGS